MRNPLRHLLERRPPAAALDGSVLAALVGPAAHGYAVTHRLLAQAGLRGPAAPGLDIPEGAVYPVLHRLERHGLVRSTWADVAGRRRRVYELTGAGAAAVQASHTEAWRPSRFGHLLRWSA